MTIFDGREHAAHLDEYIKSIILATKPKGNLLIVMVGDNPASLKYIGIKMRLCESLGIPVKFVHLESSKKDKEIFKIVREAFEDPSVSGGLIQLPIPRKSLNKLLDLIPTHKDVDIISSNNVARYYNGDFSRLTPVIRAMNYFMLRVLYGNSYSLETYISITKSEPLLREGLSGKRVYIIGNGILVGKPVSKYLGSIGVSLNSSKRYVTGDKIYSDFLILGAGHPKLVVGRDISKNCHVLDFGTSVVVDKVVGDLDKNSSLDHLGTVALSPGGIGPVVVRFLLLNFLELTYMI